MKFDDLYNQVLSEAGIIDRLRSKNYKRLANRSWKKANAAMDKAHEFEFDDPERFPHEDEFSKQMTKMNQREKKAKKLKENQDYDYARRVITPEAYDDIQFTRTFKEMPGRLNPTADAEKIAEFLNSNEVYSGSPVKGSGGWVADESTVYNDDAEGGQYLSVKIVPEKRGLIVHHKMSNGGVRKILFYWPVEAKHLNQQLQTY